MRQTTFSAIGTSWQIQVLQPIDKTVWQQSIKAIHARIEQFDKTYSRFRPDSLVSAMATKAGRYVLPGDAYALLQFYEQLYTATEGKLTPLIGQVMIDAGYDATYSLTSQPLQPPPAWEEVIRYNQHSITLLRPAMLDFGAAGKGYLIDIVGALLEASGISQYLIDAGGDLLYRSTGNDPLDVGLENPLNPSEALGVVHLRPGSLCASAGSKRRWGKYHHIIDPELLASTNRVLASWVAADQAMVADGLATALFFTPPSVLQKQFSFSYAILEPTMQLIYSKDLSVHTFKN